jgi:AraC-like DNA-binding protein
MDGKQFTDLFTDMPEIRFVGDFVVKAGWMLGPRTLSYCELIYFPVGTQTVYEVNGRNYHLSQPCIIITLPGELHACRYDPQQACRHLFIRFHFESMNVFSMLSSGESSMIILQDTSIIPLLFRHLLYFAANKPENWKERSSLLLLNCLYELEAMPRVNHDLSELNKIPYQITEAIKYIENHVHLAISVQDIARYIGWSNEHLTRQFVKYLGVSPKRTIMQKRIEKACELLIHEHWSIKQIAFAVGFSDERHFYRSFTQLQGITAKQYREKHSNHRAKHLTATKDSTANHPINRFLLFFDNKS